MNEHHKVEEKIEQSKTSNECVILFVGFKYEVQRGLATD
jgi:hypothetical protein